MKINSKKVLALVFATVMCCFVLCSCGISREEAVGVWNGTYEWEGNDFDVTFVLDSNGEYSEVVFKNGSLSSAEIGTWEIKGGKVYLHENGNTGSSVIYKYKGGALVNNDHEFTKK